MYITGVKGFSSADLDLSGVICPMLKKSLPKGRV
jgi:hypothetical protein